MAAKYYFLSELKYLALQNAQCYRSDYVFTDADNAYNYAVARCGYENPASTDTDYSFKQEWLLEMMNLWFYEDIKRRYFLKPDVGDTKFRSVFENIVNMIARLDERFEKAKMDKAYLFENAEKLFAGSVVDSGLVDDTVGQDYREKD